MRIDMIVGHAPGRTRTARAACAGRSSSRAGRRLGGAGAILAVLGAAACGGAGSGGPAAPAAPAAAASATTSPPAVAASPGTASSLEQQYEQVVSRVLPSVVQISTSEGSGSGVVYDRRGDIVTNAHVVGSATTVRVSPASGGRALPARVRSEERRVGKGG